MRWSHDYLFTCFMVSLYYVMFTLNYQCILRGCYQFTDWKTSLLNNYSKYLSRVAIADICMRIFRVKKNDSSRVPVKYSNILLYNVNKNACLKHFILFHIDLNNSSPKGRNTFSIVESVDQFSLAVNFIKIISIYTKTCTKNHRWTHKKPRNFARVFHLAINLCQHLCINNTWTFSFPLYRSIHKKASVSRTTSSCGQFKCSMTLEMTSKWLRVSWTSDIAFNFL